MLLTLDERMCWRYQAECTVEAISGHAVAAQRVQQLDQLSCIMHMNAVIGL